MLMWEKWQTSVYNTFWNSDYFFPGQNESIKLLLEHKICILARNFMPESLSLSHSWTIALQFIFCLFWYVFHLHMLALNSLCSWRWPWTYILQAADGQWLMGSDGTCTIIPYLCYLCSARDQTRGSEHNRQAWHQRGYIPSLPLYFFHFFS